MTSPRIVQVFQGPDLVADPAAFEQHRRIRRLHLPLHFTEQPFLLPFEDHSQAADLLRYSSFVT